MTRGYNGEICMIKAYELGLRNIKGYFVIGDDAILNFWQPINLDMVFHQWGTRYAARGHKHWWTWDVGQKAMEKSIDFVKNDKSCKYCQKTMEEYRKRLLNRKLINESDTAFAEMQRYEDWTVSDVCA
ncbi:hypothetical protein WR25_03823 [Diploscapter pachys]|uniref:Uncharacterized protein n=1 Tax=Diploscapter pachys TaxID=2018661 RepID=A0A2A2KX07_9BILA|nr:hypothetical protein WR25_03823 [Diploscapter pachys]